MTHAASKRPDPGTLASFLLPEVARPFVARIAAQGAQGDDLAVLSQFAPSHPHPEIHRMILGALARAMPREQVRPYFLSLFCLAGPGKAQRRRLILEVLASCDAGALVALWNDALQGERLEILRHLGRTRNRAALVEAVRTLPLLKDPDPVVRSRVVTIVGRLPSKSRKPYLRSRLKDEDARVRANALEALIPLFSCREEAVRTLQPLAQDPAPRPRATALLGLIAYGSRWAKDVLATMLGEGRVDAKASARWALKQLPKTGKPRRASAAVAPRETGRMPSLDLGSLPDVGATDRIPAITGFEVASEAKDHSAPLPLPLAS